jgi:hypothetical protein
MAEQGKRSTIMVVHARRTINSARGARSTAPAAHDQRAPGDMNNGRRDARNTDRRGHRPTSSRSRSRAAPADAGLGLGVDNAWLARFAVAQRIRRGRRLSPVQSVGQAMLGLRRPVVRQDHRQPRQEHHAGDAQGHP